MDEKRTGIFRLVGQGSIALVRHQAAWLFTYYFLKGLSGKADTNGDGEITKQELEGYISKNVAEQTQYKQNPTAMGLPGQVVSKDQFRVQRGK